MFDTPIADQESLARKAARARVDSLEGQLRLAKAILQIEQAAGWKEFADAIGSNLKAVVDQATASDCHERDYWSGVANGLKMVLSIGVSASRSVSAATKALESAKKALAAFEADGRLRPQLGDEL